MPFRKVSRGHQDLIEILHEVAERLCLQDIEYVLQFGTEDIDMFINGTYKVDIKGKNRGDKQRVKYTIILKWHADPQQRARFRDLYRREFLFYKCVMPEFLDIQKRFEIIQGLRMKYPHCIFARIEYDKETMVTFRDPSFRTYLDRFDKMDLNHASLALKNLAKLHALSFVLEKSNPRVYEDIKNKCGKDVQYSDPNSMSKYIKCYYESSVNVVKDPVAKEQLRLLLPQLWSVLNKCVSPGEYSVVCHGDCWNNNIIFEYRTGRPVDAMFVDYQLLRIASPVTDLSYFFYMSSERDFLIEHYDRLIDIYYCTLSAVLRQCYLDVKDVYPRSVFQKHLNQYSVLGLVEALVSMKIITAATEEACQMTEMKYHTEHGLSEKGFQNYSLYVDRVNGVVNDFFARSYSLHDLISDESDTK